MHLAAYENEHSSLSSTLPYGDDVADKTAHDEAAAMT
jgi:hypothetical protein